jgi:hypothetical protein
MDGFKDKRLKYPTFNQETITKLEKDVFWSGSKFYKKKKKKWNHLCLFPSFQLNLEPMLQKLNLNLKGTTMDDHNLCLFYVMLRFA